MRLPEPGSPLHRRLTLAAFVTLLLLPAPVATLLAGAMLAVAAVRAARFAARLVAPRLRTRGGPQGDIVLGVDKSGRPLRLGSDELSAHGLIVGASGAGKTTTLLTILTEEVRRGGPVVAIDLKGSPSFVNELASAAAAAGRPMKLWTLDGGAYWNPIAHGNPTELKDKLIRTEHFTEPHYMRAAERYVQTVLQVLSAAHPDRPPTIHEVVELMDPARLNGILRHVDRPLRERVQDYRSGLTHDQLSAIRGLQTRLAIVTESHIGPYLAPPTADPRADSIDLRSALSGSEVVVFSLNSSRYGQLAAQIGTLAVQDLVAVSGARLEQPRGGHPLAPAMIGIDEFSGIGSDHVAALLARGRESGMRVFVATQELVDLERASPGLRDLVLGVTAVKIFHRQEVPESARTIARIAGTEMVWDETHQIGSGLFGGYDTGHGTRRRVERFIVDPNEIQTLTPGQAVVVSKIRGARARTVRITPPQRPEPPALGR
ncbi:MAG TPA: helicase HerA-like domain-containing protein [Solirubrobacteraceae bacterium]|nr:helicase HerA-like domain-containing protein [Solirubrobacteraceae bacterium]